MEKGEGHGEVKGYLMTEILDIRQTWPPLQTLFCSTIIYNVTGAHLAPPAIMLLMGDHTHTHTHPQTAHTHLKFLPLTHKKNLWTHPPRRKKQNKQTIFSTLKIIFNIYIELQMGITFAAFHKP